MIRRFCVWKNVAVTDANSHVTTHKDKHHAAGPITREPMAGERAGETENGPQNGVGYGVRSLGEGRGTGYGPFERVGVRGTKHCPRTPVMGPGPPPNSPNYLVIVKYWGTPRRVTSWTTNKTAPDASPRDKTLDRRPPRPPHTQGPWPAHFCSLLNIFLSVLGVSECDGVWLDGRASS